MEKTGQGSGGRKLTRQRSRLQMHAPSSIQVAPADAAASTVADWNVAIPLLSPLDIVSLPSHWTPLHPTADGAPPPKDSRQPSDDDEEKQLERAKKWATWQQLTAPFYYEPVAGNGAPFLLPHCA